MFLTAQPVVQGTRSRPTPAQDRCLTDLKLRCPGLLFNPQRRWVEMNSWCHSENWCQIYQPLQPFSVISVRTFYRMCLHYQFTFGFSLLRCFSIRSRAGEKGDFCSSSSSMGLFHPKTQVKEWDILA